MSRISIYIKGAMAVLAVGMASCSKSELEEFKPEQVQPVNLTAGSMAGTPVINNDAVLVQWNVALSAPSEQAFDVSVELNSDTVQALVTNGTLENTVPLLADALEVPAHLKVPYGVKNATLEVSVSRTALERAFGKNAAFALRLVNPGKGNKIAKATGVIVLNTVELMEPGDIHYVSFGIGGGGQLPVGNRQNYISTSAGIQIPLNVSLTGAPTRPFSVRAALNTDTLEGLIAQGALPPNTRILPEDLFSLDTVVTLGGSQTTGPLNLVVPWPVLEQHVDSVLAFAVDLYGTTRHVLHPENSRVIVVIDPKNVVETDVTAEGTLSVNRENGGGPDAGEGSPKVVDGDTNTKYLNEYNTDMWMQLEYDEPVSVGAYTFTSANDADGRDPKDWKFEASQDGVNWVELDSRSGEIFSERFQTKRYDFDNTTPYKYYRISITANNGSNLFQLAEWRLIRVP